MAFLGRERELALLAEAVRRVAEGRPGRVVVTGPAGIGCSRLLVELAARISIVPGVTTCHGRAFESAAGVPYQAVGDALSGSFAHLPDERMAGLVSMAGADLAALVPGLRDRLDGLGIGYAEPTLSAPDLLGRRVIESIFGAFERLAGDGVLLLMLEDLHCADPATRDLVEALLDLGGKLPLCLVLTYQTDEVNRHHPMHRLADQLARVPGITRIELEGMSAAEIEAIAIDALGERPASGVLTAVVEGASGNPLMARELARSAASLEGVRLSDPFEQLYAARLAQLSRDAARVVRVISSARLPLARASLLSIHAPEGRLVSRGLEEALALGFVATIEDPTGSEVQLISAHELCAEAVEATELTLERQGFHAAIAARLSDQPAVAAWHWERAARPEEARTAHIAATARAARLDPGETTLLHYEAALELPSLEPVEPVEMAELLVGTARASAAADAFRRAVALMRRAIDSRAVRSRSAARGERDEATRTALGGMHELLARYQFDAGDLDGAIASMERALGIMPTAPTASRAHLLGTLAQHLMIAGRFDESTRLAEQALDVARRAADDGADTTGIRAHVLCTLGVDVAYRGDTARGLDLLAESAVLARRTARLDDLMRVAANRMYLLDLDLRREEALAVVQQFLEEARAGGLEATYGAFLRGNAADILFSLGRWGEAERVCRADLKWQTGGRQITWLSVLVLGLLLTESRADEEATSLVGRALLELQAATPEQQGTAWIIRSAISLALWNGHIEDALVVAEREWPRAVASDELGVIAYAAASMLEAAAAAAEHGRTTSDAGLIARARAVAQRVLTEADAYLATSSIGPGVGARKEAELLLQVAHAHAQRVRGEADPDAWDRLALAWQRHSIPYRQAKARWWQALAILAAAPEDDRVSARATAAVPLAEAYRLARGLPALPLMREIIDLASRARIPLPMVEGATTAEAEPGSGGMTPIAVEPGRRIPVPIGSAGPGIRADAGDRSGVAASGADIARAIEEQVIASLRRSPGDAYGLSPREREVLEILAEGRTDRDIAARLFISERTVHVHVRRILAKLGVSSRTEAAGVAIRQGLVPESAPASGNRPAD